MYYHNMTVWILAGNDFIFYGNGFDQATYTGVK